MREPLLYTRPQAANMLAMSVRRLDQITADGEIAVVRHGRRVKYRAKDLERWVQEHTLPAKRG